MKSFNLLMTTLVLPAVVALHVHSAPIIGSSTGAFVNSTGPSGSVVSGLGTSHFSWGIPTSGYGNSLGFSGESFAVETGDIFSFGTLAYHNGTTYLGTEATGVGFQVNLNLTTPVLLETFNFHFDLITTPNFGIDPLDDADIVQLNSSISSESFAYAGQVYTLEFLGFGSFSGSGAVTTIDHFHVYEYGHASAELLGRISVAPITHEAVPEPGTLALLGFGVIGLGLAARRRQA